MIFYSLLYYEEMFDFFKEEAMTNIKNIIIEPGILLLDNELISVFNLITHNEMKALGIKIFCYLEEQPFKMKANHIYYLIKANMPTCKLVCRYIELNKNSIHHIIFVPKTNITCQRIFEYYGLWQYVRIRELDITLIKITDDLLSSYSIANNDIVHSLAILQQHVGVFPIIQGVGTNARSIVEQLLQTKISNKESKIGRLIIIDRECDPITPLLSQTTYAGILDDIYHFDRNIITIKDQKYILDDNDIFYKVLKDKSINSANKTIVEMVKQYNKFISDKEKGTEKDQLLNIAKNFVPKQFLEKHFSNKLIKF